MKIFICASKYHYDKIPNLLPGIEEQGHEVTMPNSYDDPLAEVKAKKKGSHEHASWKQGMLKKGEENIAPQDAVLVLNFEKRGIPNYIGGATFLEVYTAFRLGKKIFLYNPVPECIFTDELLGMEPTIIDGDLSKIT